MKAPPPRPHPLARSPRVDRANRLLVEAWDKGWLPPPLLEAGALWESAARPLGQAAREAEHAQRSEADVDDFRARLDQLAEAAREEADLNPLGRVMAHGQLERAIRNRLRMGQVWMERPAMAQTPLAPPIIIVGHMRSGTTRIHKLLAADPAHSHTRYCDAFHPVPGRAVDLREWKAAFEIAFLGALNPWLQSIHPVASDEVEEELGWLAGAFQHSIYESQWRIPSYSAWSEARDAASVYREFARVLRTDAAHRGNADRPRVLKVPVFSENLPELLAQFPDARLIIATRDRKAVHRSAVSLVANQMAVQSDTVDLAAIEAEWDRKIALREERREGALRAWNGAVARITFEEMTADWESAIARAYGDLGIELSLAALSGMRKAMSASRNGQHRAHSAQLARFQSA
ncbi:MAG: sulfotransferase [Erythrobacter sp.]|uniref:sulfotransferase family protein n=1 Tax=Erythrobacter sp. TaxID=1042 RepID=UPI00260CBF72|nr:sulfotransferase [Erythrobacter sp.]MDJ0978777.1 sulfotransferase [Erythrobacter sp.]